MQQIRSIRRSDDEYPGRLRALEMAPEQIYLRGAWSDGLRCIAIVGSRAASATAQDRAYGLAVELARAGVAVISGGAIGVDCAAHSGALAGDGVTCAVLGTGVDIAYPQRNEPLFEEVVQRGGCLLSMFPMGTPPKPWHFPARNRVIAGLADAVLVVEAQARSGSLYTAQAALALGRPLLVMPGSPGTALLERQGARPVKRCSEIMEAFEPGDQRPCETLGQLELGVGVSAGTWKTGWVMPMLEGTTARVHGAMDKTPRDVGELSARAGLPASTCAAAVVDLELQGLCTRLSGGRYVAP